MMCYRDITFCSFNDCDNWLKCQRAFTKEIENEAGDWWERAGGDREEAPVAFFVDHPSCYLKNQERR